MFRTMNDDVIEGLFKEGMSRLEQDRLMQHLYDKGYSATDIAKKFVLSNSTVYGRINATRGRGTAFDV